MFWIFSLIFFFQSLHLTTSFHVEISLIDNNVSKTLKLICGPKLSNNSNFKNEQHRVLWNGSKFGGDEMRKFSEELQTDVLLPNISLTSSEGHLCYLVAPRNFLEKRRSSKRRDLGNSLASIPVQNGMCPPGYRIDQSLCFPCFPGSYASGQDTECFLCPKDFYVDKKGADSCWPCPGGRKTLAQGADSEEACTNFENSQEVVQQTQIWLVMYILLGIICLSVWIILLFIAIRYWMQQKSHDADQEDKESLLPENRHNYETVPGFSDAEDDIYDEIHENDTYEIPKKPSEPPEYLDLDAPPIPPKPKHLLDSRRRSTGEIRPPADSVTSRDPIYDEVPSNKSTDEHLYEEPIRKDQYEIPKKRSDLARVDTPDDSEDHLYSEIKSNEQANENEKELYYVSLHLESPSWDRIRGAPSNKENHKKINRRKQEAAFRDACQQNGRDTRRNIERSFTKSSGYR